MFSTLNKFLNRRETLLFAFIPVGAAISITQYQAANFVLYQLRGSQGDISAHRNAAEHTIFKTKHFYKLN